MKPPLGVCRRDGKTFVPVPPGSAMVLSIRQRDGPGGEATIGEAPPDDTRGDKVLLSWDGIPWHEVAGGRP